MAITVVRVHSRLREREAEALAFAVQRRVKSAALPFLRDCGNRMKDLVFIQPRDRRPCLYLYSPRLVLKEFNRDIGRLPAIELLRHHHAQPSAVLGWSTSSQSSCASTGVLAKTTAVKIPKLVPNRFMLSSPSSS